MMISEKIQIMKLLEHFMDVWEGAKSTYSVPNSPQRCSANKEHIPWAKKLSGRASRLLIKAGNADPNQIILFQIGKELFTMTLTEMTEIVCRAKDLLNFYCEMQKSEYERIGFLADRLIDKEFDMLIAELENHSVYKAVKAGKKKPEAFAVVQTKKNTAIEVNRTKFSKQTISVQFGKEMSEMTLAEKQEITGKIKELLDELETRESETNPVEPPQSEPMEFLTVKQCAALVKGFSEHAIRTLAKSGKIPYKIVGKRKMLIRKDNLMTYVK